MTSDALQDPCPGCGDRGAWLNWWYDSDRNLMMRCETCGLVFKRGRLEKGRIMKIKYKTRRQGLLAFTGGCS